MIRPTAKSEVLMTPSQNSVNQKICVGYAAAIRHIEQVEIPAVNTKIATLETLLASLQAEGVQDAQLQPVLTAIDQANQDLDGANGQLVAFAQEYEILGCASAGGAPISHH
jgi:hypothetical protein